MAHSYTQNWIHLIFTTKYKQPLISPEIEKPLFDLLKREANKIDCVIDRVNGVIDHIHILIWVNPNHSLAYVVKQLKGGSSHSLNQLYTQKENFKWQKGYGAYSVSPQNLRKVRAYIDKQKDHHLQHTFEEEMNFFSSLSKSQI